MAIRHVFKPAVTFSYAPDFTASRYGYRKEYERIDASGNSTMVAYSPYSNGIYGYPSGSKQGLISMSVSNNLEMKVRSDRDSTGYRKYRSSTNFRPRCRTTWRPAASRGATSAHDCD